MSIAENTIDNSEAEFSSLNGTEQEKQKVEVKATEETKPTIKKEGRKSISGWERTIIGMTKNGSLGIKLMVKILTLLLTPIKFVIEDVKPFPFMFLCAFTLVEATLNAPFFLPTVEKIPYKGIFNFDVNQISLILALTMGGFIGILEILKKRILSLITTIMSMGIIYHSWSIQNIKNNDPDSLTRLIIGGLLIFAIWTLSGLASKDKRMKWNEVNIFKQIYFFVYFFFYVRNINKAYEEAPKKENGSAIVKDIVKRDFKKFCSAHSLRTDDAEKYFTRRGIYDRKYFKNMT